MAELIADLPFRVMDTEGREFYVSVVGEARADGEWEGWLEYAPLDDAELLLTRTETTQSNRAALQRWAEALTDTYVEGAFSRAVAAASDALRTRVVARRAETLAAALRATVDLPDPFQLYAFGPDRMRARLGALPGATLLEIIAAFELNPAGKSLAWLSDRQLVTFIVTATEVQIRQGRRAP
jgi:hypothetical protein